MGLNACCAFFGAFLIIASGGGLAAILGVFWDDLEKGSLLKIVWFRSSNASSKDDVDVTAEGLFAGWILLSTILTTILAILTGIWGFICACRRREQFEALTYMVLCVLTAVFSTFLLIATSVVLAAHCHESTDHCLTSNYKDFYVAMFSICALSAFLMLVTFISSVLVCKNNCICCGGESETYEVNGDRNSYPMGRTNPDFPY